MFQGKVIIFSAPSGSGKTSIVKKLLERNKNLGFSISACTRQRRHNETEGKDYYFISPEEFKGKIAENAFLEWEEVYPDNFYGTLKSEVDRLWSQGQHVVFDVDVKGGLRLKKYFGGKALAVFVGVPSPEDLKMRLKARRTESEETLNRRLDKATKEMQFEDQFDVTVINRDLDEAAREAQGLYDNFTRQEPIRS